MANNLTEKHIRWLILSILHESRKSGKAQSGGWLDLDLLRRQLDTLGHPLTEHQLRDYCVYLEDQEIGCVQIEKRGQSAPYSYRYRITAKGVRAVAYEEMVPGVGIYSEEGDSD